MRIEKKKVANTAGAKDKEILWYLSIMEDTFDAIEVAGLKKQLRSDGQRVVLSI